MELKETAISRAKNMVWTAAGDYEISPRYLYYSFEGEPLLYPNTIIGLSMTILSEEHILPFLRGVEVGMDNRERLPLVLLCLEEKVFQYYVNQRPLLAELRKDYAALRLSELDLPRKYREMSHVRQQLLWYYSILEENIESLGFSKQELALHEDLKKAARLTDDKLPDALKGILKKYYFYHYIPARREETANVLGAGALMLFSSDSRGEGIFGRLLKKDKNDTDMPQETGRLQKMLTHLRSETTPEEDHAYILQCFGPSILQEQTEAYINRLLCSGLHKLCRLHFASPLIHENGHTGEFQKQIERNKQFYQKNKQTYERDIRQITEHLKSAIEDKLEIDELHATSGRLLAGRIYRAPLVHDLSVFQKEIIKQVPDFSVDLLIDASSSRIKHQEEIALQTYVVTNALSRLGIPVQVTCFRSLRGHTILQRMKAYDEDSSFLFHYYTAGGNRDGLALRGLYPLMKKEGHKNILLVLTDAFPSDTTKAYVENGIPKLQRYEEDLATNDTRDAVLYLKKQGVKIGAVFWGLSRQVPALEKIYGDSYVRIQKLQQLPEKIIQMMLTLIGTLS